MFKPAEAKLREPFINLDNQTPRPIVRLKMHWMHA